MEAAKVTPMMQQYLRIKGKYRDAILFFRLGDFYEMFFEDAEKASKILEIALTSRNRHEDRSVALRPRCRIGVRTSRRAATADRQCF